MSQNFYIGPRMISNIAFPNKSISNNGFSSFRGDVLQIQNIGEYSSKFFKMYKKIIKATGPIFVYSNFKELGGIKCLVTFLEYHGWKNYLKYGEGKKRFAIWSGDESQNVKDEIKYIHSLGHIVGTHSHTHPSPFCEIDERKMTSEVIDSKIILEELLKVKILTLAIPGGEVRHSTLKILAQAFINIPYIYTSTPFKGTYKKINSCEFIGRLCIEGKMTVNQINRYLIGKDWLLNRMNYQARRLRREIIYTFKRSR
jgi:hypothetical protein